MRHFENIEPVCPHSRSGFAYVAVLLFVTVLVVLSLSFLSRAGIGTSATLNRRFAIQAEYLAEAAVNHGMWRLLNEPDFPPAEDRYFMHDLAGGRYGYMVRRHTDSTFASLAAVGAVGESVVRRSYVLYVERTGATSQMVTGTYTGDGTDNRLIADVGFRPSVVIVKGDEKESAVIRTSTMSGDASKPMKGSEKFSPNLIQSLSAEGFTVGTDNCVNKDNKNYYWAAFRLVEGQMATGTYTGDGSVDRAITGMCFRPSLVIVFGEEKREALARIDYSVGSFDFDQGNIVNDCILAPFLDDGFRVGDNDRVNKPGEKYHYVCWPTIAGQQVSGGYTGNGTDNREIAGLGLQPEYVFVRCVSNGEHMFHRGASLGVGDMSMYFSNKTHAGNRIQALLADGFEIGRDNDVNDKGDEYAYFAWAKK